MDYKSDLELLATWDHIRLENITLRLLIGLLPEEKLEPQPVEIDLSLYGEFYKAADTADLADTADYSLVYRELKEWMSSTAFDLLETLAQHTADFLLDRFFTVQALRIKIAKPLALPDGVVASYEIFRRREEEI